MVATRLRGFGESIFARFTRLATQHGAVNLSQGFPDFDGPQPAKDAAIDAIRAGHAQYAPMIGVPPLVEALATMWNQPSMWKAEPAKHITVTCGCSEAIPATLLGLLNPGDEVIFFEPYFDFYTAAAAMAGATPRFVTLHAPASDSGEFTFDQRQLERAFTSRTRAILVNTPHNPTGKVFTREELGVIARLCQQHNVVCITDEVYEHLVYNDALPHIRVAGMPGMEDRTITLSSLGKTLSLTGWKIGWAIAPEPLTACVRAAHQFLTFSGATPLQHGAARAIPTMRQHARELCTLYARNRDALGASLRRAGLRPLRSDSTYFLMADHSTVSARLGLADDHAFCEWLTREAKVAAIPPSVFYDSKDLGRPLARFAFCKKAETIDEACARIERALGA